MTTRSSRVGPYPAMIDFRDPNESREKLPRAKGQRGGTAYIYDIEGEKLTAVQIAERLGKSTTLVNARLLRGQRTWDKLKENNIEKNRASQKRHLAAMFETNIAKRQLYRDGRRYRT
jgi:hypothetical protein